MNFEIIYKSPLDKERNRFCIMQGVDSKPSIESSVKHVKCVLALQRIPTYRVDNEYIVSITQIP